MADMAEQRKTFPKKDRDGVADMAEQRRTFTKNGRDGKVRTRSTSSPEKAVRLRYDGWREVTPQQNAGKRTAGSTSSTGVASGKE